MEIQQQKKEDFVSWATGNNWLLIGTSKTPEGYPQESYLTPAGKIVFIIYDNEDRVKSVALPMPPMPMPQSSLPRGFPPGLGFPPPPFNKG